MEASDCSDNIVLIGMPGAGKSTLGVVMAKILGKDFIDADLVIQKTCGKTLQELIDGQGADAFIRTEGRILGEISAENSIISTGGSAVYSDDAMAHLANLGPIIYLEISFESLKDRLGDLHERGVVLRDGVTVDLRDLYRERKPLYERYADVTVNVDGLTISAAVRKVIEALSRG